MGNTREEEYHTNDYRIIKDMPWSEKYIDTRLAAYQKLEDEVETCFNKVIRTSRRLFPISQIPFAGISGNE